MSATFLSCNIAAGKKVQITDDRGNVREKTSADNPVFLPAIQARIFAKQGIVTLN